MKCLAYEFWGATALSLLFLACGGTAQSGPGEEEGTGGTGTGSGGTGSGTGGGASGIGGSSLESPSELEPEVCPAFTPCGGDLSGDWKLVDACAANPDIPVDSPSCPAFTATWISTTLVGTTSLLDGVLTTFGTAEVVERFDMPLSCLQTTCQVYADQLELSLSEPGALEGGTFESLECEETSDTCVCAMTISMDADTTETYVIEGSTIFTTHEDGVSVSSSSYCVEGNRALISEEGGITVLERL
jgi:hypothetical protein